MYPLGIIVITTLYLVLRVGAQIPMPCASNYTPSTEGPKYCCPVAKVNGESMGACGSEAGRGECIEVSRLCHSEYKNETVSQQSPDCMDIDDERLNWPTQFFTHVCRCNDNYGDYDCASCAFGYTADGSGCTKTTKPRRSITSLSNDEWTTYLDLLRKAKTETSERYVVLNVTGTESSTTTITTYDLFIWVHHYAAKNHLDDYAINETGCDYAHDAIGFLTWHRIYLLWFERELQIIAKDPSFRISYWNWTNFEGENDWRSLLFNDKRLGGYDSNGLVTGDYFDAENWKTLCLGTPNTICDSSKETGELYRCPRGDYCTKDGGEWPTRNDIEEALNSMSFSDSMVFNKYSKNNFANYVEGYLPDGDCDDESTLCSPDNVSNVTFQRKLHNTVHIILGLGRLGGNAMQGAMADTLASPNDPVFINHHAMIDYILEEWLQNQDNPSYQGPTNSQFPGHAANDCAVPFIPVYTHSDVFRSAESFGYYYDTAGSGSDYYAPTGSSSDNYAPTGSGSVPGSLLVTTVAFLSLMVALLP